MNLAERFWWLMTFAGIVWYSTVTIYIAFRGALDIRQMLQRLEEQHAGDDAA